MTPQQLAALDAIKAAAQAVADNEAVLRASLADSGPPPDTEPPTMTGVLTFGPVSSSSYTVSWQPGSDNVGVVAYQISLDAGATWQMLGLVTTTTVSGRTPGTTDTVMVRDLDLAGNSSVPLSGQYTLPPASSTPTLAGLPVTVGRVDQYGPGEGAYSQFRLYLHGSGSLPLGHGNTFSAVGDSRFMVGSSARTLEWAVRVDATNASRIVALPYDKAPCACGPLETEWGGVVSGGTMRMVTERFVDALIDWVDARYPNVSRTRRSAYGSSMGAWGCITYALRRPDKFAVVWADRPRWQFEPYAGPAHDIYLRHDVNAVVRCSAATAPQTDTGVSAFVYRDGVSLIGDATKRAPFLLWCIGRNDPFTMWDDHVRAISAARAAGRGFAVVWNNGDHTTGQIMSQLEASYGQVDWQIGVGYPVLSGSSRDANPATDLVGGINEGFKWRNVAESASAWSCEIANTLGATTVTVTPHSDVFSGNRTPQTITIPAGQWVAVSFT